MGLACAGESRDWTMGIILTCLLQLPELVVPERLECIGHKAIADLDLTHSDDCRR
jgi:hypothetical protein